MTRSGIDISGVAATVDMFDDVAEMYTTNDVWIVESGARYALYVEVGTSTHAAQPYMRPAIEAVKPRIGKIIAQNGLENGLERIAREIEAEAKERAPVDTGTLRANIEAYKK